MNPRVVALANVLDGNEMGSEMLQQDLDFAKENNLVVVFGYSDDNMEFRGAIYAEIGCYEGTKAYITETGELLENDCVDDCPHFDLAKKASRKITAIWDDGKYSWSYETDIEHETFEIFEDEEPYCKGIVFSLHN